MQKDELPLGHVELPLGHVGHGFHRILTDCFQQIDLFLTFQILRFDQQCSVDENHTGLSAASSPNVGFQ